MVLWQVNFDDNEGLWWAFITVHAICWTVIYGGCMLHDLPKAFFYLAFVLVVNINVERLYNAREAEQWYKEIRHPAFLCLTVILWVTNLMSLDRLILAIMITVYTWREISV